MTPKVLIKFLLLFFGYTNIRCDDTISLINHVIEYTSKNIKTRYILLVANTTDEIPRLFNMFYQRIVQVFPSINTNLLDMLAVTNNIKSSYTKRRLIAFCNQLVLRILFVDGTKVTKSGTQIEQFLKFLRSFGPRAGARSHCLIFFLSRNIITNFREIFKSMWKEKYLYITIIEILQNQSTVNFMTDEPSIVIHQYNPFNMTYKNERFLKNVEIFPDKLKNLNGYILHALNYPYYTEEITYSEQITMAKTETEIISAIAQTMNFTKYINNNASSRTSFRRYAHDSPLLQGEGKIDFVINFTPIDKPSPRQAILCCLAFSDLNYLVVKQYGYYETILSWNSVVLIATFSIVVALFIITSRIFKLDSERWSVLNVLISLSGISRALTPKTIVEKVLDLCLMLTSFILSTKVFGHLMSSVIKQKKFHVIKAWKDLKKYHIPVITDPTTLMQVLLQNIDVYKYIISTGKVLDEPPELVKSCFYHMIKGHVNMCMSSHSFALKFQQLHKAQNDEFAISITDTPLKPVFSGMILAGKSPYANRFCTIIHRIHESGLPKYWYDYSFDNDSAKQSFFIRGLKRFVNNTDNSAYLSADVNDLMIKLLFIFSIGFCVSLLVLVYELMLKKFSVYICINFLKFKISNLKRYSKILIRK